MSDESETQQEEGWRKPQYENKLISQTHLLVMCGQVFPLQPFLAEALLPLLFPFLKSLLLFPVKSPFIYANEDSTLVPKLLF